MKQDKIVVVVPNWNGKDSLGDCLHSLMRQSRPAHIIVVDNGSRDGSVEFIRDHFPDIELIVHQKNKGFAGGVNPGLRRAMERNAVYVAPFNNDAVADKDWLRFLAQSLDERPTVGMVASKLLTADGQSIDSTGECYSIWGLPFPRGRDEPAGDQYDQQHVIFGASGGASLYRVSMLKEIGLFDEDFFAYYEDVDLSWRAQLAGWEVRYQPQALAYHHTGTTSGKIKGFTTYQTMKNLPWLLWKNVPIALLPKVWPRFVLAHTLFLVSAVSHGNPWPAIKGTFFSFGLLPKKIWQRLSIQKNRRVSVEHIGSLIVTDLPPGAIKLRRLRDTWWHITGKGHRE